MKTRLRNILKTTNDTKFSKTIIESTYKTVLGTNNCIVFGVPNVARLFVKGI